ncbi:hypothetical protein PV387_14640 [Streptomyces sp. ME02-6987-2C]|nr:MULTISPECIES: hypothetical protein [unclassified Streptomyces]MDX3345854.1 hypothetical protein [Streptomyces sp. ME02-6979A]MDX3367257.1 hypothetical protein [Streptomyces sp. ME02-6987-2C]MDX3404896.1 hypothetical protein [Streptomyces sp. ME02-6977A]MDX3421620.1 hypothetical protein [Streptomyces sp. ME02-6985-2c]
MSKAQVAAQQAEPTTEDVEVTDLVDMSVIVRSEDVEQQECFTF